MTVRVILLLLVCFSGFCASCAERGWVINDTFKFKSAHEQQQFETRAVAGDIEAGRRLADYHFFCRNDLEKALYWARVAASHGDKISAKNARTISQIIREQKG